MAFKKTLAFKQHLYVLVHGSTGAPYALRLQLRKLALLLAVTGAAFVITLGGTLLFFRELEINRRLQDRLLEWETHEKLAQVLASPARAVATSPTQSGPAAAPKTAPASSGASKRDRRSSADDDGATTASSDEGSTPTVASPASLPSTLSSPVTAGARIGELTAECAGEECSVHLSMIPTAPGTAQGQLLMVLETEMPRIGGGNPTTQIRKRYYLYPGEQAVDELDQDSLGSQQMKAFRFSRALQTQASFHIGKLQRPLAINVFLFGNDHSLIHHERKAIENEE